MLIGYLHCTFRFKNIPDQLEHVKFSSKKITDLGFHFKYSLENMYTEAIDTCREKGLLPKSTDTLLVNEVTQK